MDGNFFFVVGIVLVIAAVGAGLPRHPRERRFPPAGALMVGGIGLFAAVVATTMAFAIVKSEGRAGASATRSWRRRSQGRRPPAPRPGRPQAGGATETLDVTSPADGGLVFQPNGLIAKPGNVTITYDNPSPVPHSIAVATSNGNVLGQVHRSPHGKIGPADQPRPRASTSSTARSRATARPGCRAT